MSKPKLTIMQERAVNHGKGNALVSASAGSGKTHVVIERIIRLIIEEGVPVKSILAVTFTKLAAEEMKEKLKKALTKKYLETKSKRLRDELETVNSADISTIDSFCSKLIKKYFYVIGIDASVQVLEEGKKKRLEETAMDELFDELYEAEDKEFLNLVATFASHRSDKGLKETVLKVYGFAERANGIENLAKTSKDSYLNVYKYLNDELIGDVRELASHYRFEFSALASSFKQDEARKVFCENLSEILAKMEGAEDLFSFFSEYSKIKISLPRSKVYEPEHATTLSQTVKEYRERLEKFQAIFAIDKEVENKKLNDSYDILEGLFRLTQKYSDVLLKLKAEENSVDFADIERYALQLLKVEEIRKEVLSLYDYVFIDEYQDVNDIQEEIINLVTSDNAFLVGDSKQSIYAFRGCNPEYFSTKYKDYENGLGTAIPLDNNFRSAPKIVNGVNALFKGVMTADYGGTDYAKNPMIYGNGYEDYEGVCEMHVVPKVEKPKQEVAKRGVYSVKFATEKLEEEDVLGEVKVIADIIKDRFGKEYYDLKTRTYKQIGFGDICILLRSIAGESRLGEELVQTLVKSGVPVSSSVKKNVKDYPEIKVLLSLLSLLVNAERDVPLATVMLSLCGFIEDELATIKANGKFDRNASFYSLVEKYSKIDNSLGLKCKNFISWLEEKRLIAEFLSVDELFNSILKETGYLAKMMASTYGVSRVKRIERFIAESTVGGKKLRAVEFENHVEDVLDDIAVAESSGEDTVQIMTMHASKGLEFPVVIVAGLNKKFSNKDKSGNVLYEKSTGVGVKTFNHETMTVSENPVRSLVKARLEKRTQVEELRLFYVAVTRAKCELYLVTGADGIGASFDKHLVKSMSDFLTGGEIPVIVHDATSIEIETKSSSVTVAGKEVDGELTQKIAQNLSYRYPHESEVSLPVKTSVSDVNKAGDEEYFARTDKFGTSSSEKGTAYHRFFELIDFYGEISSELLENFVANGLMTKAQADFIELDKVRQILKEPVFSEIRGKKLLKEQKFCHLVPASELFGVKSNELVLIQGIADLIAVDSDGAVLIDYKISTIESEEDIIKAYKTQMALYKNAIEEILKLKVKRVVLVNVLQGKTIDME